MSFKRRTYNLVFEDESFNGLEVRARGGTLDQLVTLERLMELGSKLAEPDHEEDRTLWFDLLAGILIEWNLVDDNDVVVPLDAAHLAKEEFSLIAAITRAWMRATAGVSRPLPETSNTGPDSQEQFELMEVVSQSHMD